MTSRKLGIGVATAALIIMMPVAASAQADCKPELKQAGEPSVSRSLGAFPSSLFAWKKAAAAQYGTTYDAWSRSTDRRIDCKQETTGKKLWVCTRSAKPCGPGGPTTTSCSTKQRFNDPDAKLVRGMKGNDVDILQTLLNCHGARPQLKVGNGYDAATEQAVRDFQAIEDLDVDGRAGKITKQRLVDTQ